MTKTLHIDAANNGAEVGAVVPSITDMISDSVGAGTNGPTTLDDLVIRIDGLDAPSSAATDTASELPRRGRGRPRKDGSSGAAPAAAPKATRKKSELAAELERVQAELAAERARNDDNKISELSQLVKMTAYAAFGMAAAKRGEHWALEQEEADMLGSTGAVMLAPYATAISKHAPWMTFSAVLGNALLKRVQIDDARVRALAPAVTV